MRTQAIDLGACTRINTLAITLAAANLLSTPVVSWVEHTVEMDFGKPRDVLFSIGTLLGALVVVVRSYARAMRQTECQTRARLVMS